jgi:opacity protein-like surface antigen
MIVMASFSGSMPAVLLAGAIAIGSASTTLAADMPALPPAPMVEAPAPGPAQFSGWYLRGDVGYGFDQMSSFYSNASTFVSGFQYKASAVDGGAFIGGGFGYQLNNWFRGDITAEYRAPLNYSAFETYPAGTGYSAGGDAYTAKIGSTVVLANGYVDLGTWYGFTPFVGAGIGAAFLQFHGLTDVGTGPGNYGGYGTAADANLTNLAWAAMAGFDYSIAPNWKFEVGYRYLDMGRLTSNGIMCQPACAPPYEVQSFHLASQDVRVGLRYVFADVPPVAPMLPPVISKY